MLKFLKYIVFFIFCFNIAVIKAKEISFDPIDNNADQVFTTPSSPITSLPHPAFMRDILDYDYNDTSTKLATLVRYFDIRYPNEKIDSDFSSEIALIFPELTTQEVFDRADYIRLAVKSYRWGLEKYTEIKERFLLPKNPPLIVSEEDYDSPDNYQYIEPENDDEVVMVYDFKKVLSYGDNPRDIEAMEARKQHLLDEKKNKTSFEKFKSMISKLEFSKLTSYGVTLPNPFVGNAGIGKWHENAGFKVRLISDTAKIADKKELLLAVHVQVPTHRFILANTLSAELTKPQIELINTENIADYEVLYPLSVTVANENMINGYVGDFAFPIKITTENPSAMVKMHANVSFQSCDDTLDCTSISFTPELEIEQDSEDTSSDVDVFVRQSLYNIPQETSKNIQMKNLAFTPTDDGKGVEKLHFVFNYDTKLDNVGILLENSIHTLFQAPDIIISSNQIHVTVTPLTDKEILINHPLTATLRINNSSSWRQTLDLRHYKSTSSPEDNLSSVLWLIFMVGLLFNFMPIGLTVLGFKIANFPTLSPRYLLAMAAGIFTTVNLCYGLATFSTYTYLWGNAYRSMAYLVLVISGLWISLFIHNYRLNILRRHIALKGFVSGMWLVSLLAFSHTPWLTDSYHYFMAMKSHRLLLLNSLALGISFPYFLGTFFYWFSKQHLITKQISAWAFSISIVMTVISVAYLFLLSALQLSFWGFVKFILLLFITWLVLKYLAMFLEALYSITLPRSQKRITERVIIILSTVLIMVAMWSSEKLAPISSATTDTVFNENIINQKIAEGKTILVGITADWSLTSRLNDFTVLNDYTIERWQKSYNFEYINVDASTMTPEIANYLQQFGYISPPLYILYNLKLRNGLILPTFLKDHQLEQTIQNFKI